MLQLSPEPSLISPGVISIIGSKIEFKLRWTFISSSVLMCRMQTLTMSEVSSFVCLHSATASVSDNDCDTAGTVSCFMQE